MAWHPDAHWLYTTWTTIVIICGLLIKVLARYIRSGGTKTVTKRVAIDYPNEKVFDMKWIEKKPRKLVKVTFKSGKTQVYHIANDVEDAFKWSP
jgi:hypothetical protein